MTCHNYKSLMMGYLDNELEIEQKKAFKEHLASCSECKSELEEFKRLKQITDEVSLVEPEDKMWEQYWSSIYNRIERGVGWIVFSVAAILLTIYGGFKLIEEIVKDPTIGMLLKAGMLALVLGLAVLFVSALRERVYFWSKDRYRNVRR